MDFLNSMNSQVDSQMLNSQYSGIFNSGNGTQDDYALPGIESQTQMDIVKSSNVPTTINPLEIIREEDNPTPIKQPPPFAQKEAQAPIQGNPALNINDYRFQQLSQQIDVIETETQKKSQRQQGNEAPQFGAIKELNVNVPKGKLSNMSEQFRAKIDEMISKSEKMMENCKEELCKHIDEHKRKYRKNAEFIKNLLIAETEYVISEEEKNKVIDSRMESLFNEMVNILNFYQGFNK